MHLIVAFVLGLLLVPAARRVGMAMNMVDRPGRDALKIHPGDVPVLGGVAVIAATFVSLAVSGDLPAWWVAGAVAIGFAVGTLDDFRPLSPAVRVGLQIVAAAVLVAGGVTLSPLGPLAAVGQVAVVLACVNATNMIDGQDGLAGGVSAIAAGSLGVLALLLGNDDAAILALSLTGALIAFLVFNRTPATIFLGNGGAYAVGMVLASVSGMIAGTGGVRGLIAAGACLGVLAFELAFTVARRIASGVALVAGDRGHSYDLLAERIGRTRTTVVFWALAVGAAGVGVFAGSAPLSQGLAVALGAAAGGSAWGIWLLVHSRHDAKGGAAR